MGSKGLARFALVGIAAWAAVGGSGCAGERDPINQVQIGAMPKSFFIGEKFADTTDDPEFYFRTTVVDVDSGSGSESLFTNSDAQPTVRIRWEITENTLNARLSYELIADTDKTGTNGPAKADDPRTPDKPARTTQDGQVVASFTITKQFDIRRDYNSQTGEENNIILENDKDRPWQEREYIRVDWSKNNITDAYTLDAASQIGIDGAVKWDPIAYYVSDPTNPDAPVLDLEKGYFDITTKAYAAPQLIDDPDWGPFPACYLVGAYPQVNCNPSEVKLRHSFRKFVDTDYEPQDYGGKPMELFGFFTDDRYGYDRRYGIVDDKWHRFISRWNIWDKSHDANLTCNTTDGNVTPAGADPHRDLDHNGTEDECENVGRGSRCDEFKHLCTIPLRDRKVKTIAWYVNRDFPADIFDSIKKVVDTWSDAIRVGVASGRLAECRRTKDGGCEGQVGWPARWSDDWVPELSDSLPAIMTLCHNPVDPSVDNPACGEQGLSPRIGDLRYNVISYITAPQFSEPWGIMVDAEDPLTGEKIAGSVNQWGAVLDRAANTLADLVQLINGSISPDGFIAGQNVSDWVRDSQRGAPKSMTNPMSATELASRLAAFDPNVMTPFMTGKPKAAGSLRTPRARYKARMQALESAGKLPMGDPAIQQRFEKLRGTQLEAKMITPEMAQMSGYDPSVSLTKEAITRASPFSRVSPRMRRSLDRRALVGRAHKHACRREAPDPDHLLGLARKAQKLFGTVDPKDAAGVKAQHEKIVTWARQNYAIGVFSHEFGHSMGLRHNFAGTFDAASYDNHYWELRTKGGTVTKTCAAGNTDGEGCIGPRYTDPITQGEIDGGINGFATSSVMDYPGDQAQDMYLIGKYDKAAMRMGYGGTVDVWTEIGTLTNHDQKAFTALGLDDPPGLFGVKYFPNGQDNYEFIHYTQFAQIFNLVSGCHADQNSPTGTTCNGPAMDVVDYRDMKDFVPITGYDDSKMSSVVDDKGRVRRGYMFSSDEFADTGNIPSFRYDSGADPYEQIRFLESAYENRYILDAFRRNRTMFNSWDVVSRVQGHYLDSIQMIAKTFAFAMVLENDDPTKPTPELLSDGNYGPSGVGASVAFDLFARMLTRPEPGSYCSTGEDTCGGVQPYGLENYIEVPDYTPYPGTKYDFTVSLGTGRYIHNDFDYSQGYWWSDYQKQVGSFYDKTIAVYYLSEAFDDFVSNSKEDFVDGRYKNVNFATIYPNQMRRLFGSLMTGDADVYAPWNDKAAGVVYPQWHLATDLGARPATPLLMDPAFGWNEQLYTMVWGTIFLPTAWTQDFINDARITALQSEQISWPAAETITFVDPVTNITYRAHTIGTEKIFGEDREKTVGARMLDWANNLLCVAYTCQTDAGGFILLNADGTPKLKLDAKGAVILNPDYPGGDGALKKYVTNIEVMRQLVTTFVRPLEDSLPNP